MMKSFPYGDSHFEGPSIELKSGKSYKCLMVHKEVGSGKCFIRDRINKEMVWIPIPPYLYKALVKYQAESNEMVVDEDHYFDYNTEWTKWL